MRTDLTNLDLSAWKPIHEDIELLGGGREEGHSS